jgi:hypothetical protein
MSANAGTIGAPHPRSGMGPAARHVLEVVLILAISLSAIAALATLREPVVGVDHRARLPGVSQVDTRWTPKWGAAEVSAVGESAIVDTRWTAKERRAEDAAGIGSEARGSGAG